MNVDAGLANLVDDLSVLELDSEPSTTKSTRKQTQKQRKRGKRDKRGKRTRGIKKRTSKSKK